MKLFCFKIIQLVYNYLWVIFPLMCCEMPIYDCSDAKTFLKKSMRS